jgi:hypothetical protein
VAEIAIYRDDYLNVDYDAEPENVFNTQYFGNRMQSLMRSGGGRWMEVDPESLVDLAASALTEEDMMESFLGAQGEAEFSKIMDTFAFLPEEVQRAEFGSLHANTQEALLAQGYRYPEEDKNWWGDLKALPGKITSWDNPLLPGKEHALARKVPGVVGQGLDKVVLGGMSAVGWLMGFPASAAWHTLMMPFRFTERIYRASNYFNMPEGQYDDSISGQLKGMFRNPLNFIEAWNESATNESSFKKVAIDESVSLVGETNTTLLKLFLAGGLPEVYEYWKSEGKTPEEAQASMYDWYASLSDDKMVLAKDGLLEGKNAFHNVTIDRINKLTPGGRSGDLGYETMMGKVVGYPADFIVSIAIDPITWIATPANLGKLRAMRGVVPGNSNVNFLRDVSIAKRAGTPGGMRAAIEETGESVLRNEDIVKWADATGISTNGPMLDMSLDRTARNLIRNEDEIIRVFRIEEEIDTAFRLKRAEKGAEFKTRAELLDEISAETGLRSILGEFIMRNPHLAEGMDSMLSWQRLAVEQRIAFDGEKAVLKGAYSTDEVLATAEKTVAKYPSLSSPEGFWRFLRDQEGWDAMSTQFGGFAPEGMRVPTLGPVKQRWLYARDKFNKVVDFTHGAEPQQAMHELAALHLSKGNRVVLDVLTEAVEAGRIAAPLNKNQLFNLMSEPTEKMAASLGMSGKEFTSFTKLLDEAKQTVPKILSADPELAELYGYLGAKGIVSFGKGGGMIPRFKVPGQAAVQAQKNYLYERLHPIGGVNDEIQLAERLGIYAKGTGVLFGYYPWKVFRKFTDYVPKKQFIDVLSPADAIPEFKALVEMGVLAHTPRAVMEDMLRAFATGPEASRIMVQQEFLLDFLARSGALAHPNSGLDNFLETFVTHTNARYSINGADEVGLHGLNIRQAVIPGLDQAGQLSALNIIPDYSQLAEVAKHVSFYRNMAWGSHIPQTIRSITKAWRPAVLMKLGVPIRNGGEERFSWMLREGPLASFKSGLAGKSLGRYKTVDEYGRTSRPLSNALTAEEHHAILWKPLASMWRGIDNMMGVGNWAITKKAAVKAVTDNRLGWATLTAKQQRALLDDARAVIAVEKGAKYRSRFSRGMYDWSERASLRTGRFFHARFASAGMPTRRKVADWMLHKIDKEADATKLALRKSLTHPTIIDAHSQSVLGAFNVYTSPNTLSLDSLLRGAGESVQSAKLQLPMKYAQSKLTWLDNTGATAGLDFEKAVSVAQRAEMYHGDPGSMAFLDHISNYVSPRLETELTEFSDAFRMFMDEPGRVHHLGSPEQYAKLDKATGEITSSLAAIDPKSAAYTTLFVLRSEFKEGMVDLAKVFDSPLAARTASEGLKEIKWVDALDDFFTNNIGALKGRSVPASELPLFAKPGSDKVTMEDVFEVLLRGKNGKGQDPNFLAFLFRSIETELDLSKLVFNADDAAESAMRAAVSVMMRPENQQMLHATVRSNINWQRIGRPISNPVPEGMLRVWFPMVPSENGGTLAALLSGRDAVKSERFRVKLEVALKNELTKVGEPELADKVLELFSTGSFRNGGSAIDYEMLSRLWSHKHSSEFFPLVTGSSNPHVAEAVGRALEVATGSKVRTRLASKDIHTSDFLNKGGALKDRVGRPVYDVERGGVLSATDNLKLHSLPEETHRASFFGVVADPATEKLKVLAAQDIPKGLEGHSIFGISPERLFAADSVIPIQTRAGEADVAIAQILKNKKTGETVVLRKGTEQQMDWFDPEEWKLVQEQFVSGNDLLDAAENIALINATEMTSLFSSASRKEGEMEFFRPWLREFNDEVSIDAGRMAANASWGNWWDNAPERLLGYMPVSLDQNLAQAGSSAWNSIKRSWFDGVASPIVGAMAREPLFISNLSSAFKQTEGIKQLYYHTPNMYQDLGEAIGSKFAVLDEFGQLQIDEITELLTLERAGIDQAAPDLADLFKGLEEASPDLVAGAAKSISKRFSVEVAESAPLVGEGMAEELAIEITSKIEAAELFDKISSLSPAHLTEFSNWANTKFLQYNRHVEVANRRAMSLTTPFIDNHQIRSQFQEMVSGVIPFWFAEDQFLRRMARSLAVNPQMFRNLHLTMMAGVNVGLIKEDQFGEKRIIIPGSGIATAAFMEIADRIPGVENVFGGQLAAVADSGLSTDLNIIPGYDLETAGQFGFGPFVTAPMVYLAERDPSLRARFKNNLIGGRYGSPLAAETVYGAFMPPTIARLLAPLNADGWMNPQGRAKATMDIVAFMNINGQLPTEEEIAAQANPELFMEDFLARVDYSAAQLQMLQSFSWFVGPGSVALNDLVLKNEEWEWNQEFYHLVQTGIPFEDAYRLWMERIVTEEGEFDPMRFSPFRTGRTTKTPFSVLGSSDTSNVWLGENEKFVQDFRYSSTFFMPRNFVPGDDEFSSEAKNRQLAYGLRQHKTPEEFLEEIYYNNAYSTYAVKRQEYLDRKYEARARNQDTTKMDTVFNVWYAGFQKSHPVFAKHITTGSSGQRRTQTIEEFRSLIKDPSMIPAGSYNGDIYSAMATIVGLADELERLSWINDSGLARNQVKVKYFMAMTRFSEDKPWLNELYYSVFMPLIDDTWLAKFNAGLIDINPT